MNESNLVKIPLNDQTKFRLNEINKIKDYFNSEIREKKEICKKLSTCITVFDYADKVFIVLFASFGTLSISCNSCWNSCWISRCFFNCCVFFNNRNSEKIIKRDKEKKEKHNKIVLLAKSKLNSIETLMSQALIDLKQLLMRKKSMNK